MKKVLIISTSLRAGSNSEILAKEVAKGAKEKGHKVELVSLKNKKIAYCKGCLACQKLGKCAIKDDANKITEKIKKSDVIVWATPVYYYEMSGQMKTLIDRANSLFVSKNSFNEVYLITTSADSSESVIQTVINGLNGWIACFNGIKFKGYVNGAGLDNPGDVKLRDDLLEQAYKMGLGI